MFDLQEEERAAIRAAVKPVAEIMDEIGWLTVAQPGEARAEDVAQTQVVLVDLDDGDIAAKRDHLVKHLGEPSFEVASGGVTPEGQAKLHLYWRLTETTANLFAAWKAWADAAGEFPGSQKRFADLLVTRGFAKWRDTTGNRRGFRGLTLRGATWRPHAMESH